MRPSEGIMNIYKGDIFYIEKRNDTIGNEQQAGRPAIIVSNNTGNTFSNLVEVVYLTTQEKNPLPTHVEVMCHVPSTALCETIYTISKERLGGYIRTCTDEEMEAIDNALMISLGIEREAQPFTQNEDECEQLKRELDAKVNTVEYLQSQLDGLQNILAEREKEIEVLKQSDKVVILPDNTEDKVRLEIERDFYKSQYEALFERLVGKAVQA